MVFGIFEKGFVLLLLSLVLMTGCSSSPPASAGKVQVVATFFPLAELAARVGGDRVEVSTLVPPGVEPHDFEPTPGVIARLSGAKAFVTIGLGFAGVEKPLMEAAGPQLKVVSASQGVALLSVDSNELPSDAHVPAGGSDPHIWLSPKNMILMAQNVRNGLSAADPAGAAEYQKNADAFIADLNALDAEFQSGLMDCSNRVILTSHFAFAYLARDYNFRQIGISGIDPESEPSPGQIREIIDAARAYNIHVVFTEELVDPRIGDAIARDVGASTLVLSPLEGPSNPDATYLNMMRQNLENLRVGMDCK